MFFTPLLPGGVIGTDTGTLRRQVKVKRKTQPQMATQIDWSNPITRGLLRLVGDATQSDAVTRTPVTKNGTVTYNKGSGYKFQPFTASSASLIDAPTDKYTVFALAYAYTASEEIGIVTRTTNGDYRQNYFLAFVNGVQPRVGHKNLVGGAYTNIGSSISATAGSLCAAAGTFDGSTMRVYTNGVLGGSVAATSPYQTAGAFVFDTQIGAFDGIQRVRPYTGRGIQVAAIWNRALSEEEIRSLSANPYQLFTSTPQTMVATRGIVSRPNSDLSVTNNTITIRRQIKVKRKTQPNQSMTIDWSNPIANGLIFAYNGVTNTDLVKRAKGDKQNIAVDSIGKGTNITGTTDVVTISNVNNLPTTNNLSLFSLFTTTVSPATQSATNFYGGLFCKRNTIGVPGPSMYFAGGKLSVTTNNSVGTRSDFSLSGNISSVGRTTACVTGSISGSVGYINGKQTGTGIVPYWPANTSPWYIGLIRADATTENLQAIHHLDLCWNRTLTAAEVASLNANPWQLFKSTPQTMVYTKPGGGWSYNSNTSFYDAIDEPSYNDTDAIISPSLNTSPEPAKFGLDTSLDAGTYNVNVRARKTDTTGDIRATLIDSAGNVVGTSSWQTLTDIYQTYVLSVTTTATASRVGLEVRA